MSNPAILAIDQGTTNSKALLVTPSGRVVARASAAMRVAHPQPGWAELDADVLWNSVAQTIAQVAGTEGFAVAAVAISNQRESIMLWDATTNQPVGPCIIWQCRRSSDVCSRLRSEGHEPMIVEKTGLGLDPLFPAAKLSWLLDSQPGLRARAAGGELRAGTVDSWLLWKLTGGLVHATDASNASRTQLMNIETLRWDEDLAALFNVPLNILPDILPSNARFGTTQAGATRLPAGIPIQAMMGDSHAALFGHGITAPGRIKATLGTGSSLMAVSSQRAYSTHGLSSTIAWARDGAIVHALEGNISVSGQAAAFIVQLLNLKDEAELTTLASSVDTSAGVCFVPALAGLGAPHWKDRARGQITGMSLATRPAHLARAALEAIALQIRDVFVAIEADFARLGGDPLPDISVDGGAAANDMLMQLLADLLNRPVRRPDQTEVTALGVARMAGEAIGAWTDATSGPDGKTFLPQMTELDRTDILSRWYAAVETLKDNRP